MLHTLLFFCVLCVITNGQILHTACRDVEKKPVCGEDGVTYPSYCHLLKTTKFKCDGGCPCDPPELAKLGWKTVEKLAKLRQVIQLETHEEELDNDSDDIVLLEVLDKKDVKKYEGEEDRGYLQNVTAAAGCPALEMAELPHRLIDWFHVLKTNEREEKYKDQGIEREPVLREMNFIDARLKAMYSKLACGDNNDEVESEICLPSVKWMFYHLDGKEGDGHGRGDGSLSAVELSDIEQISNEHCIKPFLKICDGNKDGKVVLNEFCKCLCLTPPCTATMETIPTVFLNGKPNAFPGFFTPTCDEDGFFMPMQRNKKRRQYWCVDRNGAEISGTRGRKRPNCDINTRVLKKFVRLIPLDIQRENAPIGAGYHATS